MKYYPEKDIINLHPEIKKALIDYRIKRDFNSKQYIEQKTDLLNEYFTQYGLKTAIIAVSGGIDSAVVLGLAYLASQKPSSPIEKIIPVSLPVDTKGATNQSEALEKAYLLCNKFSLDLININVLDAFNSVLNNVEQSLKLKGDDWARGQLVAYARTPCLYYITSIMSSQGKPAVILGTNNKDEGAYLGYFGKASDGMVDLQMISDIHKSEVYLLANDMNIPKEIINAVPSGDMYDARTDEQVFGASYDFVELYLSCLEAEMPQLKDEQAQEQFDVLANNLERLHSYNGHKYLAASPAVHLDLDQYQYSFNGSWKYYNFKSKEGV